MRLAQRRLDVRAVVLCLLRRVAQREELLGREDHVGRDAHALEQLERGGVVGAVTLVDCVDSHPSPWFIGHESGGLGLVLRDARPLPFFHCRGQLSLFEVRLSPDLARLAT